MTYLYPDHLRARATLWLWDLRDIGFIGIGAVFSIACFSVSDILVPMVLTTIYGFLPSSLMAHASGILSYMHVPFL